MDGKILEGNECVLCNWLHLISIIRLYYDFVHTINNLAALQLHIYLLEFFGNILFMPGKGIEFFHWYNTYFLTIRS